CARRPPSRSRTTPRAPRRSSTTSGVRRRRWRRSSREPFLSRGNFFFRRREPLREPLQIREPELDERPDRVLETGRARLLERLLEALPDLHRVDALLQPVVSRDQELLDPFPRVFAWHFRVGTIRFSSSKWRQSASSLQTTTCSSRRRSRRFSAATAVSTSSGSHGTARRRWSW